MVGLPSEADIEAAEAEMGCRLPQDYRAFLLREEGREYWARDGTFVQLCGLDQLLQSFKVAVEYQRENHPGLVYIGGDGAAEGLAYDTRLPDPPLVLVNHASEGWGEGFYQAPNFTRFLDLVGERGWDFETPYEQHE